MTRTELIHLTEMGTWTKISRCYPLYKCKAKVYEIVSNKCYVLQSYRTMVAIAECKYDSIEVYVFNYYSATTVTHIARFKKWLCGHIGCVNFYTTYLYRHSKMSKRKYDTFSWHDWELCISDSLKEYLKGEIPDNT